MPSDPRKRQKKLERRTAKRKEKKHFQVREESAGLPGQLTAATSYPILHCSIGTTLDTQGMGTVLISRELPGRRVAVATFLVDRFCLGIKDAHSEILDRLSYDEKYVRGMARENPSRPVPPAEALKFVEVAVEYAENIGFQPHPDYHRAVLLFGSTDPAESDAQFEFGKNGKPLFIAGPYDDQERCRSIGAILTRTCGPNGFHVIIPLASPGSVLLEGVDSDEEFDED